MGSMELPHGICLRFYGYDDAVSFKQNSAFNGQMISVQPIVPSGTCSFFLEPTDVDSFFECD